MSITEGGDCVIEKPSSDIAYVVADLEGGIDDCPRYSTPEEAWIEAREQHDAGQVKVEIYQMSLVGVITE